MNSAITVRDIDPGDVSWLKSKFRTPIKSTVPGGVWPEQILDAQSFRLTTIYFVVVLELLSLVRLRAFFLGDKLQSSVQ